MRFPHVKIGQVFTYQGKQYTKTGPMTASDEESGASCMIRRSAEVMTQEATGVAEKTDPKSFTYEQVNDLLEAYRAELKSHLLTTTDEAKALSLSDVLVHIDRLNVDQFLSTEAVRRLLSQ